MIKTLSFDVEKEEPSIFSLIIRCIHHCIGIIFIMLIYPFVIEAGYSVWRDKK